MMQPLHEAIVNIVDGVLTDNGLVPIGTVRTEEYLIAIDQHIIHLVRLHRLHKRR